MKRLWVANYSFHLLQYPDPINLEVNKFYVNNLDAKKILNILFLNLPQELPHQAA